jgi:hypothetical protein
MAPELNSMAELGGASQTPRLQKSMEQSKLWSSSAIELEFWSTSFATPTPDNMKLNMELVGNYPPLSPISGK